MARTLHRLSARQVTTISGKGRHADGGGLYLYVAPDGRRWVFMYTWAGKRVELGLGSTSIVSLARARERAREYREYVADGIDPRTKRNEEKPIPTFAVFSEEFITAKEGGWRNEKHVAQWRMTMQEYAAPLSKKMVSDIATDDVLAVLQPIWLEKPETASRVRGRIEAILDAAKAKGFRDGDNPARWRGHLKMLLPARKKLSRGHHKAMPYAEVPALVKALLAAPSVSNMALAFAILTAGRSGEIMGAVWSEIDQEGRLWHVPAERMKGHRPHDVPLSDAAAAIIKAMTNKRRANNKHVFPGDGARCLSVMALAMALRRAGAEDCTVHGMRSAFRDWCGDRTNFQRDDVELCLAHQIKDETERAYRRGDALDKRRAIMDAWAAFLTETPAANVIDFRSA